MDTMHPMPYIFLFRLFIFNIPVLFCNSTFHLAEALFQGEDLDIKVNKYVHEVNDCSAQCSLLIKCAEFLIFLLNSHGDKICAWVNRCHRTADQEESFCCSVGSGKV